MLTPANKHVNGRYLGLVEHGPQTRTIETYTVLPPLSINDMCESTMSSPTRESRTNSASYTLCARCADIPHADRAQLESTCL